MSLNQCPFYILQTTKLRQVDFLDFWKTEKDMYKGKHNAFSISCNLYEIMPFF